jgi:hypothetical protein
VSLAQLHRFGRADRIQPLFSLGIKELIDMISILRYLATCKIYVMSRLASVVVLGMLHHVTRAAFATTLLPSRR